MRRADTPIASCAAPVILNRPRICTGKTSIRKTDTAEHAPTTRNVLFTTKSIPFLSFSPYSIPSRGTIVSAPPDTNIETNEREKLHTEKTIMPSVPAVLMTIRLRNSVFKNSRQVLINDARPLFAISPR